MNINIINIGHYRITDYGRNAYQLFNRKLDKVYDIRKDQFDAIKGDMSIAACKFVEEQLVFLGEWN